MLASSSIYNTVGCGVSGQKSIDIIVKGWFVAALAGQWAFAIYILCVYVTPWFTNIDIGEVTPTQGYHTANSFDYAMFFAHIVPAAYLSLFGAMQLIPSLRKKYPNLHRWNGRIFFTLGISGALTGLYLQWGVGLRLSDIGALGITLNGILIPIAIFFAWKHAINRRMQDHMRWAIHSFILVNAVWSFRLYLMGWYMINQGPLGNSPTVDGPTDIALSFACYLLPMLFAEIYFWLKKQKDTKRIWTGAMFLLTGALITLIGVVAATMMMWFPRIAQVAGLIQ